MNERSSWRVLRPDTRHEEEEDAVLISPDVEARYSTFYNPS